MRKWQVGDKVKILNVKKISAAESAGYKDGCIYEVVDVDDYDGTPILQALEKIPNDRFVLFLEELQYLELVK